MPQLPGFPSGAPGSRRTRASDAQRTHVWQALDDAFAEGRLSHFEHFERTRTTSRAKYVDELRPLIADLRGGDADLGLDPDPPEPDETEHPRPRHRRRGLAAGVAIAVFTLAVVGGAVVATVSDGPSGTSSSSSQTDVGPGPLHTAEGLERMLTSAQAEFGSQDIDTLTIYGSSATILREDPTAPGTRLTHSFRNGEWEETAFSSRTDSPTLPVDAITPDAVMTAIEAAPDELGMDDAEISHVFISPDALGDPEYRVSVSEGDDGDLGTATFGPDGEVRERNEPR